MFRIIFFLKIFKNCFWKEVGDPPQLKKREKMVWLNFFFFFSFAGQGIKNIAEKSPNCYLVCWFFFAPLGFFAGLFFKDF